MFTWALRAEIDFRDRIVGRTGVFEPLEDIEYFERVTIEPDSRTITWPNEVDFCPETLHEWPIALAAAE